jgi:RNA polymerase I-specific transcription initiation factor RRN7
MSLNDTNTITVMGKRRNSESEATTHEMTARQQDIHMPELSVAAAWVVVMKLAYGLDGKER